MSTLNEIMKSKYFTKPTIYLSHPVRGTTGDTVGNCKKTLNDIEKVERLFPEIGFYVPARGDLVLQILYDRKILSEHHILDADLDVVRNCHGWCFYRFDESSGGEIERTEAIDCGFIEGYEHDVMYDIGKASYPVIRKTFMPIVDKCIKCFRETRQKI